MSINYIYIKFFFFCPNPAIAKCGQWCGGNMFFKTLLFLYFLVSSIALWVFAFFSPLFLPLLFLKTFHKESTIFKPELLLVKTMAPVAGFPPQTFIYSGASSLAAQIMPLFFSCTRTALLCFFHILHFVPLWTCWKTLKESWKVLKIRQKERSRVLFSAKDNSIQNDRLPSPIVCSVLKEPLRLYLRGCHR